MFEPESPNPWMESALYRMPGRKERGGLDMPMVLVPPDRGGAGGAFAAEPARYHVTSSNSGPGAGCRGREGAFTPVVEAMGRSTDPMHRDHAEAED